MTIILSWDHQNVCFIFQCRPISTSYSRCCNICKEDDSNIDAKLCITKHWGTPMDSIKQQMITAERRWPNLRLPSSCQGAGTKRKNPDSFLAVDRAVLALKRTERSEGCHRLPRWSVVSITSSSSDWPFLKHPFLFYWPQWSLQANVVEPQRPSNLVTARSRHLKELNLKNTIKTLWKRKNDKLEVLSNVQDVST